MTDQATGSGLEPRTLRGDGQQPDIRMTFTVNARRYDARVERTARGANILVTCPLGHLPYSAENRAGRHATLMVLSAAGSLPGARLMLTDFQKISMLVAEPVTDPDDPRSILESTAAAVLRSEPLCELLSNCQSGNA